MAEIDLMREVLERRIIDGEQETRREIEELRVAINVLVERVAELTVNAPAASSAREEAIEEAAEAREPEPGTAAADENEELAEELEEEGVDPAAVAEVTDIINEIAEESEEETRPERMHWLHRPLFGRRDMVE